MGQRGRLGVGSGSGRRRLPLAGLARGAEGLLFRPFRSRLRKAGSPGTGGGWQRAHRGAYSCYGAGSCTIPILLLRVRTTLPRVPSRAGARITPPPHTPPSSSHASSAGRRGPQRRTGKKDYRVRVRPIVSVPPFSVSSANTERTE